MIQKEDHVPEMNLRIGTFSGWCQPKGDGGHFWADFW